MKSRTPLQDALTNRNVDAFMCILDVGEHGPHAKSPDRYRTMYGGSLFDAPPWAHPRRKVTAGRWTSTAAGRGQFLAGTWDGLVKQYGFPDFSPQCQDEAIVALIAGRGALADVIAGRLWTALRKCNKEWASLPGSPYGQPVLTFQKAGEVYTAAGGELTEEFEAQAAQQPAGATITPEPVPTPQPKPKESPMGAILAAVLPSLFSAAPDLIRLFGGGGAMTERNAAVAQKVAEVAVKVTGAVNEQEAAEKIQSDPAAAQAFRQAVSENFDQWMGMMVKFAELDEASRAKAREFAVAYGRDPVAGRFTFVEFLSLLFVVVAAVGGGFVLVDPFGKFTTEMQTAVVILMIVGGWNGVKEFWFGSSMGSMKKDQTIQQQTKG